MSLVVLLEYMIPEISTDLISTLGAYSSHELKIKHDLLALMLDTQKSVADYKFSSELIDICAQINKKTKHKYKGGADNFLHSVRKISTVELYNILVKIYSIYYYFNTIEYILNNTLEYNTIEY